MFLGKSDRGYLATAADSIDTNLSLSFFIFFNRFRFFAKELAKNFFSKEKKSLNEIWITSVKNELFQKKQCCFFNNLKMTILRKYEEKASGSILSVFTYIPFDKTVSGGRL